MATLGQVGGGVAPQRSAVDVDHRCLLQVQEPSASRVIRRRALRAARLSRREAVAVRTIRRRASGRRRRRRDGSIDVGDARRRLRPALLRRGGIDRLRDALVDESSAGPVVDLDGQRIGAPIAKPYQVLGIGLNYADHAAETGSGDPRPSPSCSTRRRRRVDRSRRRRAPAARTARTPTGRSSSPSSSAPPARYLADEAAAHDCIAGYAIANDVSERHFQQDRGGQWVKGKSFETFNPLGPWLVTPDEAGDVGRPRAASRRQRRDGCRTRRRRR